MDKKILKLLILEDNPDDAELEVKELERKGFIFDWERVETKNDFKKSLKEKPDLILADYKLPSFSGPEASKIQQKLNPDTPLIIITGTVGEEQVVECMKAGATDYVLKDKLYRLSPVVKRALKEAEERKERKKAEEALRKNEEKYRLLADNSIDAIWQMDLKLVFTYISPSVKNVMGYTVEEWVGSRLSQHATTKEYFNMEREALYAIKNYKKLKYLVFEAKMLRKDGTEISVEITGKLLLNKKGLPIGLQGTTHDISERKQANEALRKSEERFRFITENTGDVLYRLQYDTMIFDYLSPAIYTLTGYTAEEINKISFKSIINQTVLPGAPDVSSEELKKKQRQGKTGEWRAEYKILSKGGEEKWLEDHSFPWKDDSGKIIGSTGILQNITKRKQADGELQEKMNELETFYHATLGREERVVELKQEVNELLEQLGKKKKYGDYNK